jgi:hypothetical protein
MDRQATEQLDRDMWEGMRLLASEGHFSPTVFPLVRVGQDGSYGELWPAGTSQADIEAWKRWERLVAIATGWVRGKRGAPGPRPVCPTCGRVHDSEGFVRRPGNPFDGAIPMEHQSAALSTMGEHDQQTEPKKEDSGGGFHPAFWVMAAASVVGVTIELVRYMNDRKREKAAS